MPFGYVSVLVERADLPERDMEERLRVSGRHVPEKIVDGSSVYLAVPMRHQLRGIGACWSATLARQLAYLGSEAEKIVFVDGFRQMDAWVLRELPPDKRERDKYAEFRKIVTTFIDRSMPLSWTVTRWKSKDSKDGGRHRRMIIGYDASRELIYYSDPWGFQNDRHSMPMRAAFAMTLWMQAICPESFAHGEIVKASR